MDISRILMDIATLLFVLGTAGYVAWRCLKKSTDPKALIFKWVITLVLIFGTIHILPKFPEAMWPVIVLIPAMTIGVMWAPSVGAMMASAITGDLDGGGKEIEPQPFYSVAEFKRRNKEYEESAQAVREQLEKFPNDFPGVMLLASILAEDLHDLAGAESVLEGWIQDPAATHLGISSALTAMADWHLHIGQDPDAARLALERIEKTMPDTPLAHRAAQRLAHLPTREHLMNLKDTPSVDLPAAEKYLGLRKAGYGSVTSDQEALAQEYVIQLEQHPADTATREKLAVLYADHFRRLDLAVDQLEQLIQYPNESPRHIAEWLNLLADLHIRVANDLPAAEAVLRRISDLFPNSGVAEQSMERLAALERETKATQKTQLKKLGQYEKNIGLKPSKPA